MVSGVALISWDIGIVAVSSQIPDPIEPAFLKNKNDAIIEDYTNAALQLKEDPMLAVELMAQSMSDTVEEEGVMYVSGSALTYLIPTSLFVKFIKEGSAVKGVGKARVGDGNVGTGAKGIEAGTKISEADKVKLEKWNRAPDEALYLAHKKTYDNKKFFNQETGDIIYPGSKGDINTNGFVKGVSNEKTLPVGEIIDRYGDNGGGQYFSPVGSSYESRALPPFMKDKPYEKYEVIREFKVDSGTVVKWFDEPGGGTQFYTSHKILDEKGNYVDADVDNLILYKYIKRIDKGDLE